MNNIMENPEKLLDRGICGFHIYALTAPYHICFASQNLCGMLGCESAELLSDEKDMYAEFVHPADRKIYSDFISHASESANTQTLRYRLIKKDGSVIYVSDTVTVEKLSDGSLTGCSVLTDITDLKKEGGTLRILNDAMPCGFIKYTCEKTPKITYVNKQMLKMLRFPETSDTSDPSHDFGVDNIYMMIPVEYRRKFASYLNRVSTQGTPLAGELTIMRYDGSKGYLFGWVTKCINEDGSEEFQSVCMDITNSFKQRKQAQTRKYINALTEVYDKIFEYDLSVSTVKCLHAQEDSRFKRLEDIPMQMEEATEKWIRDTVSPDDREKVRSFFNDFYKNRLSSTTSEIDQIKYKALSTDGTMKAYSGIFLKIDSSVSLFCCRNIPDTEDADNLRIENTSLKNMQELVMRFSDGIAAFEVTEDRVTPMYASDNVYEFFGVSKNEWMMLMKKSTPIKDFVSRSEVAYDDFVELLKNGEAEFTYFDLKMQKERRIKAICSEKTQDSSPRYVMLYKMGDAVKPASETDTEKPNVYVRTFGYFDVFVNDKPIAFRSQKSKELLALLVDRRGGYISSEEAISFLWEDEPVSPVTLARYRKVALRLKNILEEYGISEVVESVDGRRRIVTEKVSCDLFDYLSGKEEYSQLFRGSYLTNYSWGETTLAELVGNGMF